MIATEPLPKEIWDTIGWDGRETLGDMAHAYMYAQRTADDRIALGGRGVPYRYGSRTDNDGRTQPATIEALRDILVRFFPTTAGVRIDHAWSGVLGVPRDWCATVTLDRSTGLGWAGGYVGSGVATTNLAARTLRDLIQQDSGQSGPTDLTDPALGQPQGPHAGSRNPSAGSASTACTRPTAPRTAGSSPPPPRHRPRRQGGGPAGGASLTDGDPAKIFWRSREPANPRWPEYPLHAPLITRCRVMRRSRLGSPVERARRVRKDGALWDHSAWQGEANEVRHGGAGSVESDVEVAWFE